MARLVKAWLGWATHGKAVLAWYGEVWQGTARFGKARQLRHGHWSMFDVRISIIHLERRK